MELPSIQHLIFVKSEDFKCNSDFVINSLKQALVNIKSTFNNVKLVITDAVRYNIAAKNYLSILYPSLRWVTCFTHLLNNCCTQITKKYPDVSKFISLVNDLIYSSKSFHHMLPENKKPPEVVITRWGTWLRAVKYYSNFFGHFRKIILSNNFILNSNRNVELKNIVKKVGGDL